MSLFVRNMFLRLLLCTCLLVNAARLEEERDLLDIASEGGDASIDFIDFEHTGLSNDGTSNFIAMGQETAPQPRRKKSSRGRGPSRVEAGTMDG